MKRLSDIDIEQLKALKEKGISRVYMRIRKVYGSWYVRLFHVADLMEGRHIPSYWYEGKGDCTERQAVKDGCIGLKAVMTREARELFTTDEEKWEKFVTE